MRWDVRKRSSHFLEGVLLGVYARSSNKTGVLSFEDGDFAMLRQDYDPGHSERKIGHAMSFVSRNGCVQLALKLLTLLA